jgi:hypothetical protein
MVDKKPKEVTDLELLHEWLNAVGGNILLGESALKSLEKSKDGDKLTIVLKKNKPKKNTEQD